MIRESSAVGGEVMMLPRNPSFTSLGILPLWSMWAWVRNSVSMALGSNPHSPQFRLSICRPPWNIPQSTSTFLPPGLSTR